MYDGPQLVLKRMYEQTNFLRDYQRNGLISQAQLLGEED